MRLSSPRYPTAAESDDEIARGLQRVAQALGWNSPEGGPFGNLLSSRSRVLIKPNFVLHQNQGGWGLEPLVTHASLVRTVTKAALRAGASEVIVGDAPIQNCILDTLLSLTGLADWAEGLMRQEPRFK